MTPDELKTLWLQMLVDAQTHLLNNWTDSNKVESMNKAVRLGALNVIMLQALDGFEVQG